jgi:hypothetical protein
LQKNITFPELLHGEEDLKQKIYGKFSDEKTHIYIMCVFSFKSIEKL